MTRGLSLLAVLLSSLAAACSSGEPAPSHFPPSQVPDPNGTTEPTLLDLFAAESTTAYKLGAGDKLNIQVWGRPEISGPSTVGPDGRISVPIAGSMVCANLTREQAEQSIEDALQKYYKAVAVTVRVEEYGSNRISVLGNVRAPGSFPFVSQPTLLSALSQAGGLGDLKNGVSSPRCSVTRGRTQIVWIDLAELLWRGNVGLNIPLQRDDVVYVPDGTGVMVYVLGEVKTPGVVRLTPGMSYLDAIGVAGGLTEDALEDGTRILRPTDSQRADVPFDELMEGDLSLNAELKEGDIIYVPTRGLEKWNYFWRKINPFAGIFTVNSN